MKKITGFVVIISILLYISLLQGKDIQKPIRIGVASMITPIETVKYYQDLVEYVSNKMDVPVEMIHRRTYEEMDRMLEKGEVDVAFICSAPYVRDKREFGVELLVAPVVNGSPFYQSYIIVHKDSNIRSFDNLKGKTFAFTDPRSNSGKLYPEYYLAKKGLTPEEFFKKYVYTYSHNKSVELVAKKIVDGAAVESLVYNYMKKKNSPYPLQTRIIHRSPVFGIPPVVVVKGLSTFIKEKIRNVLLEMHRDPEGRKILDTMQIERFVVVSDKNYDSIREMESFVSQFRGIRRRAEEKPKSIVFFGVIPRDNPRIAYEKYQPLMDYLSEHSPYTYELVLKKDYEDTVNALGMGDIDVAILGPLSYLEAHAYYGAICILKGITEKGKPFDRSVIITTKESSIKDLKDIKGRSFAFASPKSTLGNLIPRYMLADAGIHLQDLKEYKNFNYYDSVVKWILRGRYDAGGVREMVADKYLSLGLKTIAISDPIPTPPVVIGPKTPYLIVEDIKTQLLNLSKTEEGRVVLEKLDPSFRGGFIPAKDSDYKKIREMINNVPKTCGAGCHPKIRL